MTTFLTILYVLVCLFLILVVLLQAGRGGGMGSAFGGSSQTVFGGAGAGNFLTRLTVIMAATFMFLSATLAYLSSGSDKALERAARAVKTREEARTLGPDSKTGAAKGGAGSGDQALTSTPASSDVSGESAPVEQAPAATEGEQGEGAQAPADEPESGSNEAAHKAGEDKTAQGAAPKAAGQQNKPGAANGGDATKPAETPATPAEK